MSERDAHRAICEITAPEPDLAPVTSGHTVRHPKYARDTLCDDDNWLVERRRNREHSQSPMTTSEAIAGAGRSRADSRSGPRDRP